jgi:hypothetical protein
LRAALGNALQSLQVILEPQVKYVVQEMLDEHAEIDDEAGPKDPTAHLLRQAKYQERRTDGMSHNAASTVGATPAG